jgi:hypothetical protein
VTQQGPRAGRASAGTFGGTKRASSRRWIVVGALALPLAWSCNAVLGIQDADEIPGATDTEGGFYGDATGEPDGASEDQQVATDGAPDAPDSASDAGDAGTPACRSDSDCVAPSACYSGHCDPYTRACAFEYCVPSAGACMAAICGAGMKCGPASAHGFRTAQFSAGGALGCGGDAHRCFAAVYPFVFVGTAHGVSAYPVADFTNNAPTGIALSSVTFDPGQLVASGQRLYIFGKVEGPSAPYPLPIAVLDVPTDPTATRLAAVTATLQYPEPDVLAIPSPDAGAFIVFNDAARKFAATILSPPLPDGQAVTLYSSPGLPASESFVAASGDRLVAQSGETFSLEANGGTPHAQNAGAVSVGLPAFLAASPAVSAPDGTVLFSASYEPFSGCIDQPGTVATRVYWVVTDAAGTPSGTNFVETEITGGGCQAGLSTPSSAAIAWIDAKRALFVTRAQISDDTATALVVQRNPGAVVRRLSLGVPLRTSKVAAASADHWAYVLTSDQQGNGMTVTVLDPNCN